MVDFRCEMDCLVGISASAYDPIAVTGVQFLLDGANLGTEVTSVPYSLICDSTTVAPGASTTFTLQMNALATGTYSGTV